jgi:hypothetical protein
MKNLVLSCLAVCALITVVGCSDNNPPASSTTSSSATMSSDTKDMGNHHEMSH